MEEPSPPLLASTVRAARALAAVGGLVAGAVEEGDPSRLALLAERAAAAARSLRESAVREAERRSGGSVDVL